jgi:hypothetical protein
MYNAYDIFPSHNAGAVETHFETKEVSDVSPRMIRGKSNTRVIGAAVG